MSTIVIDDKYALSDSDSVDADAPRCANCGVASDRLKKCAKCRRAHFCNAACQRAAWDAHEAERRAFARECVADANAKPAYKPPEPPRMPTKAEKEEAKESETRRIRETTLPRARAALRRDGVSTTVDLDELIEGLEDAIVFAIGEEDQGLTREVRLVLARAYLEAKRADECLHYLAPALEEARKEGGAASADAHTLAAKAHCAKGEKEQCRKELTAALDCASESTSDEAQCDTLLDAGIILHDLGDWERCAPLLSTAGEAAEKLGRLREAARAYNRAGSALLRSGRPDYAGRCWTRELRVLEADDSTDPGTLAQAFANCASAFLLTRGEDDDAFNLHKKSALTKARESGNDAEARVYLQLGNAYKLAGDAIDDSLARAKDCFEKAKSLSATDAGEIASRALEMLSL